MIVTKIGRRLRKLMLPYRATNVTAQSAAAGLAHVVLVQRKYLDKKHGDPVECPTCGFHGLLDVDTPQGEQVAFQDQAVWWNPHTGWECSECWLK